MNILLLSMSTFPYLGNKEDEKDKPRRLRKSRFTYMNNKVEEYYSQLEPITRVLIENGNKPDEVIALCTKESTTEGEYRLDDDKIDTKSPLGFYISRINEVAGKNNKIIYTKFPQGEDAYLDPKDIKSKNMAVAEIALYLLSKKNSLKNNEKLHLWIDTQGGMRDVSLLMNAVVSLLKTSDIKIEGIYSINYTDGIGNVIEQNDTYHIFDFVSGMNEFIQYGRADQLVKYYGLNNKSTNANIPALVTQMKELADSIMLCDLNRFDNGLKAIRKTLDEWNENNESNDVLLNIFVEQIKDDYEEISKENASAVDKIKWFHKKKLYQQTLTYIESNGPKDWDSSGVLKFSWIKGIKNDKEPSQTDMVNRYIGYAIQGIYEKMNESHTEALDTLLKEGNDGLKYWKTNKNGKKRKLLKDSFNAINRKTENGKKKTETIYEYKVESEKNDVDENQLYKLIAFYKLIKLERNLFNHMDNGNVENNNECKNKQRMQIDKLDTLIDSYVDTCEKLYQ